MGSLIGYRINKVMERVGSVDLELNPGPPGVQANVLTAVALVRASVGNLKKN